MTDAQWARIEPLFPTAGIWPFAHPSLAVVEAQRHPGLAGTRVDFSGRLGRTLHLATAGLLTCGSRVSPDPPADPAPVRSP
ncbi:hypothetical protein [Streptomyces sp. TLI_55]|uniref:hypothetical protein n=1 Tax=Streptomyces sp. TLI_55 TaxID=1938861 RepID=UPI00211C09C0|nr:hypothetical protein [Streptomyces sp. TLI_55]